MYGALRVKHAVLTSIEHKACRIVQQKRQIQMQHRTQPFYPTIELRWEHGGFVRRHNGGPLTIFLVRGLERATLSNIDMQVEKIRKVNFLRKKTWNTCWGVQ